MYSPDTVAGDLASRSGDQSSSAGATEDEDSNRVTDEELENLQQQLCGMGFNDRTLNEDVLTATHFDLELVSTILAFFAHRHCCLAPCSHLSYGGTGFGHSGARIACGATGGAAHGVLETFF